MPSYDGNSTIFGRSVSITMEPTPSALQENTAFGVTGVHTLWGGNRGRIFTVEGTLYDTTRSGVDSARALLLSYADGIGRTLVDTGGNTWTNVIFTGQFQPIGKYDSGHSGVCLRYRAVFRGLV